MNDKETKKRLKKIKKKVKKLKKELKKMEFRPCQNDADLKKKEEDLRNLMDTIYEMEKEMDRFILDSGRINQFEGVKNE